MASRPRLVYVTTHPASAETLLRGQPAFMRERGFDVTVVSSPGKELDHVAERERVRTVAVPMVRSVSPLQDLLSLERLRKTFQALRPDIVNASTPKAGFLGMVAARAVGVPVRIYMLQGLRLETEAGALRTVLSATERTAAACAHDVVCVSRSLLRVAVEGGHVPRAKASVLADGSSNGVEVERWTRTSERIAVGYQRLAALGVSRDDELVGYVGRFHRDKGLEALLDAFEHVRAKRGGAKLLFVGAGLVGDEDKKFEARARATRGVILMPHTSDLAPIYARIKVLALPSYREGLPNAPLEAAVAEVPTVGFAATGIVDAVLDGETGTLVAPHDVRAFADALVRYLEHEGLRERHARAARARAERLFRRERVWQAWEEHYRARLIALGPDR